MGLLGKPNVFAELRYALLRFSGGVWHTSPGSIPGITMVESKRVPVRLRPPPTWKNRWDFYKKTDAIRATLGYGFLGENGKVLPVSIYISHNDFIDSKRSI